MTKKEMKELSNEVLAEIVGSNTRAIPAWLVTLLLKLIEKVLPIIIEKIKEKLEQKAA